MKVLILGGTGAIGLYLVQILVNKGILTFITSRKCHKSDNNIQYIQGDAHDINFLKRILKINEWDAIVDFMVYNTKTFKERVDILLTNTKQYIFLSSARVYAYFKKPIIETSPRLLDISDDKNYLKTDEYALSKARQEDVLKNSVYKNYTIIRPYITYSENRLQLGVLEKEEWLYRALHDKTIVLTSDIMEVTTTLTCGLDVAKGIVSIIGRNNTLGECFHITDSKSIKWHDVLNIYMSVLEKHIGYKPKILLLKLSKYELTYQIIYDRLFDRCFDNSKIAQYIDINDFVKIEEGINTCLKDFIKNPQFKKINWRQQAKMDKICNEKTSLSEIQGIKQKIKYLLFRYY